MIRLIYFDLISLRRLNRLRIITHKIINLAGLHLILNGLLGVAEEELYLDWEVTGFWNPSTSFNHARRFDKLVEGFMKKVPGANLHEKIENYVLALGFTKADIEKFRSMMLE